MIQKKSKSNETKQNTEDKVLLSQSQQKWLFDFLLLVPGIFQLSFQPIQIQISTGGPYTALI